MVAIDFQGMPPLGGRGLSTFVWICVFEPPTPPTFYFRKRNFVSLTERGNFSVYAQCVFNSPKAAAGLPHLSRKKGECASLSTVFANCDLRFFWIFSREVFWPPKFAYSRRRFSIYIYICEDIYILVLFL